MFGYVMTDYKALSPDEQTRFRAVYCGLCRTLKARYGDLERLTLSYDMTFLTLLLSALYEPEEKTGEGRCAAHPAKKQPWAVSELTEYAADINVLLAWHKCDDDRRDDGRLLFGAARRLLDGAYKSAKARRPEQAEVIERWMRENARLEAQKDVGIDAPMNLTGDMLGRLFAARDDYWRAALYALGAGLGRFIYFMDAYEDLESDIRRGRFNALIPLKDEPGFEELCRQSLSMMMGECAQAFESLPIVRDADLIRNILYSGVWAKYVRLQNKKSGQKSVSKSDRKET